MPLNHSNCSFLLQKYSAVAADWGIRSARVLKGPERYLWSHKMKNAPAGARFRVLMTFSDRLGVQHFQQLAQIAFVGIVGIIAEIAVKPQ
jgi:hypothetical protein